MSKRAQAWMITLNTNSSEIKLSSPLRKTWKYIVEHMISFSYGLPGTKVITVKENSEIEVGHKYHKAHLHGFVEIVSMGLVSLNYSKIKEFVDTQLKRLKGYTGCHFDAQLVKNYDAPRRIKEYIEKEKDEDRDVDDEYDNFEVQT